MTALRCLLYLTHCALVLLIACGVPACLVDLSPLGGRRAYVFAAFFAAVAVGLFGFLDETRKVLGL